MIVSDSPSSYLADAERAVRMLDSFSSLMMVLRVEKPSVGTTRPSPRIRLARGRSRDSRGAEQPLRDMPTGDDVDNNHPSPETATFAQREERPKGVSKRCHSGQCPLGDTTLHLYQHDGGVDLDGVVIGPIGYCFWWSSTPVWHDS